MRRKSLSIILCLVIAATAYGQINFNYLQADSLNRQLLNAKSDTSRVLLLTNLAEAYRWSNPDSAMYLAQKALEISKRIKFPRGEASALISISVVQRELGNLAKALDLATQALSIAQLHHYDAEEINALIRVANVYLASKDFNKDLLYLHQAEEKSRKVGNVLYVNITQWLIAAAFEQMNELDSAWHYADKALNGPQLDAGLDFAYNVLGDIHLKLKRDSLALQCYRIGLVEASRANDYRTAANLNISLANYFRQHNQIDSAIYHAKQALAVAQFLSYKNRIISSSSILAQLYETKDANEALKYYKILNTAKENLYGAEKMQALQTLMMDEQEKQKQAEAATLAYRNRIRQYTLIGGLLFFLVVMSLLYRNNRRKQKANTLLQKQKQEIEERKAQAEIETALEKVRTIAMAMRKPDDMLEICKTISQQLGILKVKEVRNVQTAIFYEEKGTYMNYEYYSKHDKLIITEVGFKGHPAQYEFAYKMLQGPDEFFILNLEGQQLKEWYDYQKTTPQFADSFLETTSSLNYYWYSMGQVALGLSTYAPLSEQQIDLFKRFRNVFELSYRRYLDIEKAEAQAREAQIEAALEKVRSRSLAMHRSEELQEVVHTVFEKLEELKVNFYTLIIVIFQEGSKDVVWWMQNKVNQQYPKILIKYADIRYLRDVFETKKNGGELLSYCYSGEEKHEMYNYLLQHTDLKHVAENQKKFLLENEFAAISVAIEKNTGIHITSYSKKSFSAQENETLNRFAKVFEQAYIRFMDLQKAEVQVREAKIEAALERTRTQSMIMQHSKELDDTLRVFHEQVLLLGIPSAFSFLWLPDEEKDRHIFWAAWAENSSFKSKAIDYLLDRNEPATAQCLIDWKSNEPVVSYHVPPPSVKDYFAAWSELIAGVDELKPESFNDGLYYVEAFMKYGCFGIMVKNTLPEDEKKILSRFAVEFERAYTRFLDLQKAEAQAKEAQIETALEKVRSRSMAMHQSNDLLDVVRVLSDQLLTLGLKFDTASFAKIHEDGSWDLWISTPDQPYPAQIYVPYFDHPIFREVKEADDRRESFFERNYTLEEKNSFFKYFFENTAAKNIPDVRKQYVLNCTGFARSVFLLKNIWLSVANYRGIPFSKEENAMLQRFANVFEQSYTRFLDLQKAEAQARESQIQLALERVRARTMAMHNSSELADTTGVLFQQFMNLGITPKRCLIGIMDKKNQSCEFFYTGFDGKVIPSPDLVPLNEQENLKQLYNAWLKNKDHLYFKLVGQQRVNWTTYIMNKAKMQFPEYKPDKINLKQISSVPAVFNTFFFTQGFIMLHTVDEIPEPEISMLKRFSGVFEQTYTRFLDLQKAETQAKEAQTQLALERVRARTMAMQKSDELQEVVNSVYERLNELEVEMNGAAICTFIEGTKDYNVWIGDSPEPLRITFNEFTQVQRDYNDAIERREELFTNTYSGEIKKEYIRFLLEQTVLGINIPEEQKQLLLASPFFTTSLACTKNTVFQLYRYAEKSFSKEENDMLKRFANVFEQAYTRFLDLQKAEAQAREAQIEAALEKVRSRSLAMHTTNELGEVVKVIVEKLQDLGVVLDANGVILCTYFHDSKDVLHWIVSPDFSMAGSYLLPYFDHPIFNAAWHSKESGDEYFSEAFSVEEKNSFFECAFEHSDYKHFPEEFKQWVFQNDKHSLSFAWQKNSAILIPSHTGVLPTEADKAILIRFSKVFEQAYVRFLDMKKAEAQAREAQIEAALERVRARAMAMYASQELQDVVKELRRQIGQLGQNELDTCVIQLYDESPDYLHSYASMKPSNNKEEIREFYRLIPKKGLHIIEESLQAYSSGKKDYTLVNEKEKLKQWMVFMKETYPDIYAVAIETLGSEPEQVPTYWSFSDFNGGSLLMVTLDAPNDISRKLLRKFANVFGLAYRRFVDIKHAEAQAREATIESALEKVRGKAMAMHNSNDLSVTASMVFTELRKLGINPIRCGVGLLNKESRKAQLFSDASSPDGDGLSLVGWVLLEGHPVLEKIYDTWQKNEDYFPELTGEQLKQYYELLLAGLPVNVPDWQDDQKQYGHFFSFSIGCLYAWSENPYNDAEIKILKRFASIIDLTFRRYLDLQKSEASTKEAVKQAALDRIRADIASMRTVDDLDRIIPLVWDELTTLGVAFIRCGVFIMKNEEQQIHTFLSTPDGKAIAAFHLPYNTKGKISQVLKHWQNNETYMDHWDEDAFREFANSLVEQGALKSSKQYLSTLPAGGFYLQFVPFLQGMLYVGTSMELSDDEIKLLHSVAEAFSTAYARYEDFNKLEGAKKQVEKTLVELKQAQTQLIQSEKMASLGELTAGVAHEIQNPLNFVNNFSEVSSELLDEIKSELDKGDIDEAKSIADDVKQNLEKIAHHGKRADAIVKSMLQHSRKSSGQKDTVDINALVDEYLRLSYHGFRAKDKSFNAITETHFDPAVGKINIVGQDIGRVLLNLFNNAFYAVNKKKNSSNSEGEHYEPTIQVTTTRTAEGVRIKVRDNGIGIPDKVLEKIYQPFFTTKPTGEGTGLGLSLSYDIITKGHGGELKVETEEGQGSEFIIQLPLT